MFASIYQYNNQDQLQTIQTLIQRVSVKPLHCSSLSEPLWSMRRGFI